MFLTLTPKLARLRVLCRVGWPSGLRRMLGVHVYRKVPRVRIPVPPPMINMSDLKIQENYPLRDLTTMRVGGTALYFVEVKTVKEVEQAIKWSDGKKDVPVFVLSGGSNLVVSDEGFSGLVVYINILGYEKVENGDGVLIKVGAGEEWDKGVERAVGDDLWGIENLSLIPGRMGAFVVQNAGAYGQECNDVLEKVEVYDKEEEKVTELRNKDCEFSYRSSIFNNKEKGRYIILSVYLRLKKKGEPKIDYPDVIKYFREKGIDTPSLKQIRQAILHIRSNKLPKVEEIGSAGSFFRNLVLNNEEYLILKENILKNFDESMVEKLEELKNKFSRDGKIKIPTGWLVDICGFKGFCLNGICVWHKQALVLVNESGKAQASDVMEVFKKIRQGVYKKTGMKLEMEPELVGFSEEEKEKYFKL